MARFSARRKALGLDCSEAAINPETGKAYGTPVKQSFKDECDINRVLDRAKHGASLSHLLKHQGTYGDFSTWDERTYEDMQNQLARGVSIFNDLPAELRNEFNNNPGKFFQFVNDPANTDRLEDIFPALAAPGRQFPDVIGQQTAQALVSAVQQLATASSNAPTDTDASTEQPTEPPSGGSSG